MILLDPRFHLDPAPIALLVVNPKMTNLQAMASEPLATNDVARASKQAAHQATLEN